jgi:hypothetical protein
VQVTQRDPDFLRWFHVHCDAFHWGVTSKKKHRNCSPCACANTVPGQLRKNGSLAEQKNTRNSKLHAILPYLSQDHAHDVMQMHMKHINDIQKINNVVNASTSGNEKGIKAPYPCFVVDAICLPRLARNTFIQRDWLAAGAQTQRYLNPHPVEKRKMIPSSRHCDALKSLCVLSNDYHSFKFVAYNEEISSMLAYVARSRKPLMWLLRLERKDDPLSNSRFQQGELVRLHSRVVCVRELLLHWSCRNREAQLLFPSVSDNLKHFVDLPVRSPARKSSYQYDPMQFLQLRSRAPIPLTALLELGMHGQSSNHISIECIQLLELIMNIANHEYSQTSEPCTIRGEHFTRVSCLHGKPLLPDVNLPRLVSSTPAGHT